MKHLFSKLIELSFLVKIKAIALLDSSSVLALLLQRPEP